MSRRSVIAVLYEDASLLVINKPAGLLSIPGRDISEESLLDSLKKNSTSPLVVHRLDRDTSGVLIFAKTPDVHRALSLQFSERSITKTYHAIVVGRPVEDTFSINEHLLVDGHGKVMVSAGGKASFTRCQVVERFSRYTLMEVNPITGRQHQIRVHLAHKGYPLAVDPLYGSAKPLTIADIKPGVRRSGEEGSPESALIKRTPLHASSVEVVHPEGGQPMVFKAPMPKDMLATLTQLRKWCR